MHFMYMEEQAHFDWSLQLWPVFARRSASFNDEDGKNIFEKLPDKIKSPLWKEQSSPLRLELIKKSICFQFDCILVLFYHFYEV